MIESKLSAKQYLDREFLEIRCRLLDIASAMDRMSRAGDSTAIRSDYRLQLISQALGVVADDKPNHAERVQLAFSDAYEANWRASLNVPKNGT